MEMASKCRWKDRTWAKNHPRKEALRSSTSRCNSVTVKLLSNSWKITRGGPVKSWSGKSIGRFLKPWITCTSEILFTGTLNPRISFWIIIRTQDWATLDWPNAFSPYQHRRAQHWTSTLQPTFRTSKKVTSPLIKRPRSPESKWRLAWAPYALQPLSRSLTVPEKSNIIALRRIYTPSAWCS